jgi:hypothetical protein
MRSHGLLRDARWGRPGLMREMFATWWHADGETSPMDTADSCACAGATLRC